MSIVRCTEAPKGRSKTQCPQFEEQAAITPKRYETAKCQLLLITNRKLHTGFRLVPTSMTLNDFERHNRPFCVFSPNSIALKADYVTVVKCRSKLSEKYCLPFPVYYFWPKLTHPAAPSLCDS